MACRLLAASLPFKSLRLLTVPPVPSPKVMLVAVPLPVAPIVSVRPSSGVAAVRAVVPAVRPNAVSDVPVPEITRSDVVPVLIWSAPAEIVEAVPVPVMLSIAESRVPTVSVLPVPVPIVTLPEPSVVEVVCAVENVIVLPLTVRTPVGVAAKVSEVRSADQQGRRGDRRRRSRGCC